VGSIPTRGTDEPQKSGNASEFQNEARFVFEMIRSVSFCGFQNDGFGKILPLKSFPPEVRMNHKKVETLASYEM